MFNEKNTIFALFRLFIFFSKKIKGLFIIVLFFSISTSIFDLLSVVSIIPFLSALPGMKSEIQSENLIFSFINFGGNQILTNMILIAVLVFLASTTRIYNLHYANKLVAKLSHLITKEIFQIRFGTSFEHLTETDIKKSTAKLILFITKAVESMTYLTKFSTALFIGVLISLFLVFTKPFISIPTLLIIGSVYILLGFDSRKKMDTLSKNMARYTENQIQIIQEIYGMSRNLYLDESFQSISKDYYQYDKKNRNLYALSEFLGSYPRFVIEAFAIIIITALTVLLTFINNSTSYNIIPFLGAFAFASQRLLPAYQAIYANWAGIKANDEFVKDILKTIINKKKPTLYQIAKKNSEIKKISFHKISFEFKTSHNRKKIIENFSYTFNSGSRVAIIGKTGIGKSTFLDIISCLRYPTNGSLYFEDIDGSMLLENTNKNASNKDIVKISNCALVPQINYVINNSMAKNISLSNPYEKIDFKRINFAAQISKLSEFINSNEEGFDFNPTKNGFCLSGGQVQRLAIARAIYKMSPILLMDEATSALDRKTSIEIINNIFKLNHLKFIFAITHSSYYLDKFTHIIEIKNNGQIEVIDNK